jgi:hypothetical protein
MGHYKVVVDDNFHYMESSCRNVHGTCKTAREAIAACRGIVDRSLEEGYQPGMSAEGLYDCYVRFGDDPFIEMLTVRMPIPNSQLGAMRRSAVAQSTSAWARQIQTEIQAGVFFTQVRMQVVASFRHASWAITLPL